MGVPSLNQKARACMEGGAQQENSAVLRNPNQGGGENT